MKYYVNPEENKINQENKNKKNKKIKNNNKQSTISKKDLGLTENCKILLE